MESTNHYFRPLGLIILFCLFPVWVLAQTVSVTGMVKDASGEPRKCHDFDSFPVRREEILSCLFHKSVFPGLPGQCPGHSF